MDVVLALEELGGVASRRTLVVMTSEKRVRRALEHGVVMRLPRGQVALVTQDRAERAALSCRGQVSHASAALLHGWAVVTVPELPQVTVRPGTRALTEPLEVAECFPGRPTLGRVTPPLQTVLDCARDMPFVESLAIADSALRARSVRRPELLDAAARVRGPARERTQRVARLADGRAANPLESALRALCVEAGLDVVPQWEVRVSEKVTVHPDLADPIRGLAIEAESWTHHGKEKPDFERDCERYTLLALAGWTVLRFSYDQVMRRRAWVLGVLREAAGRI